jgi:diguanylate cyclase (GGDEF)-like protein
MSVLLPPTTPINETERLLSLHSLRILDTPTEERFDRITRMAKRLFGVEICLISLVDTHRQWFKSKQGLDACETSREISFCGHAINNDDVMVISDACGDERFADNPLVTEAPFIRFYAGCPIRAPSGHRVGTLCLIDSRQRSLNSEDQDTLREFAQMVEDQLVIASEATVDVLTKVANRRGFHMVANHMLDLCRRTETNAQLLFFDLDHFKGLNDRHGHRVGDELLRHFAGLLVSCFRSADVIARLGGDEFVVMMAATPDESRIAIARLEEMAAAEDCDVRRELAWSVGSVSFDADRHATVGSMLADADSLMYQDKLQRRRTGS